MRRMRMMGRASMVIILMSLMVFAMPKLSHSQEKYPVRPITLIQGWTAGGQGDVINRSLTNSASKQLGQPFVMEYKTGAHGTIAAQAVLKSEPDGYTLAPGISSLFVIIPNIRKLGFDLANEPTQILTYFEYEFALVVRSDAPWNTWEEFRDFSRKNPGKVTYGTAGVGTMQHITFERVARQEGIQWVHVPFKGGNEPIIALLGGHLDSAIQGPADVLQHIRTGKLKMLLALNDRRWSVAPNAPHIREKGYGFATFALGSLYGPKGLPDPIRSKLENTFRKATEDPSFIDSMQKLGVYIKFVGGKEYTQMVKEKYEEYKKIVKDLGLEEK